MRAVSIIPPLSTIMSSIFPFVPRVTKKILDSSYYINERKTNRNSTYKKIFLCDIMNVAQAVAQI